MISFNAKVEILSIQDKTLKTAAGKDFSFTELVVKDLSERMPTRLTVRLGKDTIKEDFIVGKIIDAEILIFSNEGRDGRIWNNFIVSSIKETPKNIPDIVNQIGKEKTNMDVLDEAQDFMDSIPF